MLADVAVLAPGRTVSHHERSQLLARRRTVALMIDSAAAATAALVAMVAVGRPAPAVLLATPVLAALGWTLLLAATGRYRDPVLTGSRQTAALLRSGIHALAAIAAIGWLLGSTPTREGVLVGVPIAVAGSLVGRLALRRHIARARRDGRGLRRVVAVGSGPGIATFVQDLSSATISELIVVGACVEGGGQAADSVPVVASLPGRRAGERVLSEDEVVARVVGAAREVGADTVCVTEYSSFTGQRLRMLSWLLADHGLDLVVAPGLVEVDEDRLRVEHAGSATVLHVRAPRVGGLRGAAKTGLDTILSAGLLLVLSPLLLAVAVAIKIDNPGPVLFRQTRTGIAGRPFSMLKFRTMVVGADAMRLGELADRNENSGLMFKIRRDPRVTRVGRLLRRYSLDELPQLVNVLRGQMSLVGPRPPLPDEVAGYDGISRRRLHVKPGLTGLWQVSGRSDLTWDETVRLDLRYVDNWSLGLDMALLWQTGRAVVTGEGAY